MAEVTLHIEDDAGNTATFHEESIDRAVFDAPDVAIDGLLTVVYAKARTIYPYKEDND